MSFDLDQLYSLLPAVYRIRDAEQGEPLKALLSVIAEEIAVLEEDLAQLYDDQFIETCAEWVVPYIGDLVGDRTPYSVTTKIPTPRAEVANTIAYRRRKGTATMLEQLARDVTGWDARVVEFFQWLGTTQYLNHLRPHNLAWVSLRAWEPLERLDTAFNSVAHTLDVRRIETGRGRYNIPNIGIFLWRLQAYLINRRSAFPVTEGLYFTFNPVGIDAPLFNIPQTEDEITHLATPKNVPEALSRRLLYEDLETLRQQLADVAAEPLHQREVAERKIKEQSSYFGKNSVIKVFLGDHDEPIPPESIVIGDLTDWSLPPSSIDYTPEDPNASVVTFPIQVAIDPFLGRIAFPSPVSPQTVAVSYAYGFSGNLGGGPYERPEADQGADYYVSTVEELRDILANLNSASSTVVIEIEANARLIGDFLLELQPEQQLTLQGENGTQPVILGNFLMIPADKAEVILDGLLISQGIQLSGMAEMTLLLRHCTLLPWQTLTDDQPDSPDFPSLDWPGQGHLRLDHTISGAIAVSSGVDVTASDSIIDALDPGTPHADPEIPRHFALAGNLGGTEAAGKTQIVRTTVFGKILVQEIILAENSIFTGLVTVERKQQGCIRFCYLPSDSLVPRRYRCQPSNEDPPKPIYPQFTARYYGHPAYGQLSRQCPLEIRQGADDESEMGAFHHLYQPQRETNLKLYLDRYLRFGLEAGIFYVT